MRGLPLLAVGAIALLGGCESSWRAEVRDDNYWRYMAEAHEDLAKVERACGRGKDEACEVVSFLRHGASTIATKQDLGSLEQACAREREARDAKPHAPQVSCVELGRVLLLGVGGVARDGRRAVAILRDACQRGIAAGCAHVGLAAELGLAGEPQDVAAAVEQYAPHCTYREFLAAGDRPYRREEVKPMTSNPLACHRLGVLSLHGRGVPHDPRLAAHLFASLCVDGELVDIACAPAAALYLRYGLHYFPPPTNGNIQFMGPIGGDGRGVRRDPETWAREACAAGSVDGCRLVRQINEHRDEHSLAFDAR